MALITLANVTIAFEGVAAVESVSYEINRGDYLVVVVSMVLLILDLNQQMKSHLQKKSLVEQFQRITSRQLKKVSMKLLNLAHSQASQLSV